MSSQQKIISGLRPFTTGKLSLKTGVNSTPKENVIPVLPMESFSSGPNSQAFKDVSNALTSLHEIKSNLSELSSDGFQDEIRSITNLMDSLMNKQKQMMSSLVTKDLK